VNNNVVNNNSWQSYKVGAVIRVADGREFTIERVETRETEKGRQTRLFHLVGPNGERVVKTSRGLSLWASGAEKSGHDTGSDVVAEEAERIAVRDHYAEGGNKSLAEIIAEAVRDTGLVTAEGGTGGGVDIDEVTKIVDERIAALIPQRIEVVTVEGVANDVGVQHVQFEALLAAVAARRNCWLVGPAGSGKTSSAHAVADSLGLPFYAKSVGPQTSESSLLGYHDANGKVVRTQLRDAYEHGGVFLLDEVDAANPAVLVVINQLLANGHASFPDAVVAKHADFVLIAGANTIGQGADRQYVGRQQIDAATLDRFVLVDWPYDPRIEAAACGLSLELFAEAPQAKGIKVHPVKTEVEKAVAEERVTAYVKKVVAVRNAIASLGKGVRVIVSPRASINGVALLRAGWPVDATLDACVWKGLDKDTRSKIEANL
jgi:cobaltochelatase CobS